MRWVREMQGRNWSPPYSDLDDPDELLDEMAAGKSGACRRCSRVLVGALLAMRLRARLVVGTPGFDQREVSHCLVEVWIGEMGKWVLLDPTFDTAFDLDGKPASLFEVYQAYREGEQQRLQFDRRGSTFLPAPAHEFYRRALRHIYIAKLKRTPSLKGMRFDSFLTSRSVSCTTATARRRRILNARNSAICLPGRRSY
jgi:transglutaminase-like putative cysteine protease